MNIKEDKPNNIAKIYFKDSGIGIPVTMNWMEVFNAFIKVLTNYRNSLNWTSSIKKSFMDKSLEDVRTWEPILKKLNWIL
jgi:hypothetical protein